MNEHQRKLYCAVMDGAEFTRGEKRVLAYLWSKDTEGARRREESESFYNALMEAVFRADDNNQGKLALAFPEEVAAVRRWRHGDLCAVWQGMGLRV